MNVLLIGGSKGGKSMMAQNIVRDTNRSNLVYLASMEPVDEEDNARILRHKQERDGWGFVTVEQPRDLQLCLHKIPKDSAVLFDSVTALLANEMFSSKDVDFDAPTRVYDEIFQLCNHAHDVIIICDYIFSDAEDYDEVTEAYRKGLANICRRLADICDAVGEVSCGIVKWHKGCVG